jgi:hypothetical protein
MKLHNHFYKFIEKAEKENGNFTLRQPYTSFRDIAFWLGFSYEKTLLTAIKTPLTCSSLHPSVLWVASKPMGK